MEAMHSPFGSTLLRTWEEYRQSAARSRTMAKRLRRGRVIVLFNTLLGAVFGALAVNSVGWAAGSIHLPWLSRTFGGLSAVCLGLSALYARQLLQSEMERSFVLLRSVAEALKSEAFKYMAKVPPYHEEDADDRLSDKAKAILSEGLPGDHIETDKTDKRQGLPNDWLSADDYIRLRARQQIDQYYRPQTQRNANSVRLVQSAIFILGACGVVLGGWKATQIEATWTAAWIGVVGTASGALAAYLYAGRFQYLKTSYDLTARRLEWLIDDWFRLARKDVNADPTSFILSCEDAIFVENRGWLAEWAKKTEVSGKGPTELTAAGEPSR